MESYGEKQAAAYDAVHDRESHRASLSDTEQSEGLLYDAPVTYQRRPSRRWWYVHGAIALVNLIIFAASVARSQLPRLPAAPYSPAQHVVAYENYAFNYSIFQADSKYSGEPRPEQAQAWSELMSHMGIWVTEEELHKMNRTSVKVPGQGYLSEIGMFHQLHCLDYLRKYIYRDYYPIHETNHTIRKHVSHCIDSLRQAIQCHGDTSMITYSWRDDYARPWPDFQINKQCRNYEALKAWTESRSVTHAIEPNPYYDKKWDGTSPPGRENTTELLSGTRLNPLLIHDLESSPADTY